MSSDGSRHTPVTVGTGAAAEAFGCDDRIHEVRLFVDGELAEPERVGFEVHLDACDPCRRMARHEMAFREAIRTKVRAVAAPASLRARLAGALDKEPSPAPGRLQVQLRRLLSPFPVAAAGATALGLSAWMALGTPKDDVMRDIVARHSRRLPLEFVSSDPQSLEAWLSDKVDFRVRVPRMQHPPLALVGARLSHVRDHAAVYLLYGTPQSPSRHVSLLVFDDPAKTVPVNGEMQRIADHDVYVANSAGYNVATWKQNEVVYSLVSDGDEDVMELLRATDR